MSTRSRYDPWFSDVVRPPTSDEPLPPGDWPLMIRLVSAHETLPPLTVLRNVIDQGEFGPVYGIRRS